MNRQYNKTSSITAIDFSSSHKVDQPLALFIPVVCAASPVINLYIIICLSETSIHYTMQDIIMFAHLLKLTVCLHWPSLIALLIGKKKINVDFVRGKYIT